MIVPELRDLLVVAVALLLEDDSTHQVRVIIEVLVYLAATLAGP